MMKLNAFAPSLPVLPAVSNTHPANTARVGANTSSIFGQYLHPFVPMKDGVPSKRALHLFHIRVPENITPENLFKVMPSWISIFDHPNTVTVTRVIKDGLNYFSEPFFSLTQSPKMSRLILNENPLKPPSSKKDHFFYSSSSFEDKPPTSVLEWGFNKSAKIVPSENPPFSKLIVSPYKNHDGVNLEDISKSTVISFHPNDPYVPVLYHENPGIEGMQDFPTSVKAAINYYFNMPDAETLIAHIKGLKNKR
jgi:hypothetical protein